MTLSHPHLGKIVIRSVCTLWHMSQQTLDCSTPPMWAYLGYFFEQTSSSAGGSRRRPEACLNNLRIVFSAFLPSQFIEQFCKIMIFSYIFRNFVWGFREIPTRFHQNWLKKWQNLQNHTTNSYFVPCKKKYQKNDENLPKNEFRTVQKNSDLVRTFGMSFGTRSGGL